MTKSASRSAAPVQALLFMLLGVFCFAIVDATTKWLTAGYGTWQIMVLSRIPPLILALAVTMQATGSPFRLQTKFLKTHAFRGVLVLITTYAFYDALRHLPLADCIAIAFAAPLFVTAMSGPFLGERVGWRRWCAVAVGFGGVLIAVRPTGGAVNIGAILVLVSAATYAMLLVTLRPLSGKESTHNILFYSTAISILGSLPLGFVDWVPPSAFDWGLFMIQGTASAVAQLAMIRAFRLGEASLLAPIEYTALIWATIFGVLFWNQLPTPQVLAGAAVIVAASLYIAQREARLARHQQKRDSQTVPEHASLPE